MQLQGNSHPYWVKALQVQSVAGRSPHTSVVSPFPMLCKESINSFVLQSEPWMGCGLCLLWEPNIAVRRVHCLGLSLEGSLAIR